MKLARDKVTTGAPRLSPPPSPTNGITPPSSTATSPADRADLAKRRLQTAKGDPLVFADWQRVLFLHYAVDPALVRARLPKAFELELHEGRAIVSVVALTMRRFRPNPVGPWWPRILQTIREQRFLNVRTYARHEDEPGTFFFWSWLSRPLGIRWPAQPFGLTCAFARSTYRHEPRQGRLSGVVTSARGQFEYRAPLEPRTGYTLCAPGSVSEFALEQYTGYFWRRGEGRVFRAWHPAWLRTPVAIDVADNSLLTGAFPWFNEAPLVGADYAPGFEGVWLGRPHRLGRNNSVQP